VAVSENLTQRIEIKKPLTADEKDDLLKKISDAREVIEDETDRLKIHKDDSKEICDTQNDIITNCIDVYRKGYTSKLAECSVKYNDGEATFTDMATGEIVEQRPMTEAEQLRLTSNFIDAEKIIRDSTKNEE
jgi:hypothetical protein